MSSLVGKGAFFFGIQKTFITEVMKIPEIKCKAMMPPNMNTISLELKDEKE